MPLRARPKENVSKGWRLGNPLWEALPSRTCPTVPTDRQD
jgi:hypothetical protein